MTLHMSQPISTTTNCELFKTPNDIICIAVNGIDDSLCGC